MPFHVIEGTYHVVGYSPDGDSIRFKAKNPSNWGLLDGPPAGLNGRGHAQLRLEAIDTLETHYQGVQQPKELADLAMRHLLSELGISDVVWNSLGTMVTSANDGSAGFIVSREVEKNRRPVAFAYSGTPSVADGAQIFLTADLAEQSANAEMLRSGLAYPTYYKGLFPDLRNALTAIVKDARLGLKGLWPVDQTNLGFVVSGLESITEDAVILPKLFRRLATYLEGGGVVEGFKEYLAQQAEEVLIISTVHSTHFDTVVEVEGTTVKMTELPENLIFAG